MSAPIPAIMPATPQLCYIALGSNCNQPISQISQAYKHLKQLPNSQWLGSSSLYQSTAIGSQQADFINSIAGVKTLLKPLELLAALQVIEHQMQRKKSHRWADRNIDLDIILYGQNIIDYPSLRIPHPQCSKRDFVLYPLFELVPDLQLPFGCSLESLLARCSDNGLTKLNV